MVNLKLNNFLIKGFIFNALTVFVCAFVVSGCATNKKIKPYVVTTPLPNDPDDAAVWIDSKSPHKSRIYINDKHKNGGIYVFELDGKPAADISAQSLQRPNNIDAIQGLNWVLNKDSVQGLLFATERLTQKVKVYALPDLKLVNLEGFDVFVEDTSKNVDRHSPMGIAVGSNKAKDTLHIYVSRKNGPSVGYLAEYQLTHSQKHGLKWEFVRNLGLFSGLKEIESVAVNHALNELIYSDEGFGIRTFSLTKQTNDSFGMKQFKADVEGICVVNGLTDFPDGLICVSDQQRNSINFFNAKTKQFFGKVRIAATETDGIDYLPLLSAELPYGTLLVMNNKNHNFHYYSLKQLIDRIPKN